MKNYANSADPEKKMDFWASKYDSFTPENMPDFSLGVDGGIGLRDVEAEGVPIERAQPRRVRTAKKKTQGYWHGFVLWLRTKLLRMGAR